MPSSILTTTVATTIMMRILNMKALAMIVMVMMKRKINTIKKKVMRALIVLCWVLHPNTVAEIMVYAIII